jgi:hypothetical protein
MLKAKRRKTSNKGITGIRHKQKDGYTIINDRGGRFKGFIKTFTKKKKK